MDISIDMLNVGNADAIIIWYREGNTDAVLFIDGGNEKDGEAVVKHYEAYISPYISSTSPILVINTHPHKDHIGGLQYLVNYFKNRISVFYINNPSEYLTTFNKSTIESYFTKYGAKNSTIKAIYESLNDSISLLDLIDSYGIKRSTYFSDLDLGHSLFKIKGPSMDFYTKQIQYFANSSNLEKIASSILSEDVVNDVLESVTPCKILDEKNDDNAENLSSAIIELTDSYNKNYLFTSDASVDSFISSLENGISYSNYKIVQLPHPASRRNINSNLIKLFNPNQYWVSANGDSKHPRKAVLECVKKNLPGCKIYSTHKGGTKHINSNNAMFPERPGWTTAVSLI